MTLERGERLLQKKKGCGRAQLALRLQRHAHERRRAAHPVAGSPGAPNRYLGWQEFYQWAPIMDCEHGIPDWLARELGKVCPGFVEAEKQYLARYPKEAPPGMNPAQPLDRRAHIRSCGAKSWLSVIRSYVVREPRYQKAAVCRSESAQKWPRARPIQYPAFDELAPWGRPVRRDSQSSSQRFARQRACFKPVDPGRLAQAAARFIDWEAVAYSA